MSKPAKRTNPERREESQDRILDAAEAAFARRGFDGVSLKDISRQADVDTSLLHYYFSTKANLFKAVIERRAVTINQTRMASLTAYEAQAGSDLSVAGVLSAYLKPTFEMARNGGDGVRSYLTIIAKVNSTPAGELAGVDTSQFDPVIHHLIALLGKAAPERSEAELYWFYHMLSGAITLSFAQTGRIDHLSRGLCASSDFRTIERHMVDFFAGGL